MDEPEFDLTLADIDYELWALDEHLQALEGQIAFMQHPDRLKTYADLKGKGFASEEIDTVLDVHDHRVNRILPRMLRGSFLIVLWAVFEASALEIAALLRKRKSVVAKVPDAKPAADLVKNLVRYVTEKLGLPLALNAACEGSLGDLLLVRDAFAHANGRVDAIRHNRMKRIDTMITSGLVEDEDGFLIPSALLLKQSHAAVRDALQTFMKAYEQAA